MCKTGGPRCKGSRKASRATAQVSGGTAVADRPAEPATSTSTSTSTVPSRDDADRLAAAYDPKATGWDGKPLSERDRRMYALRDSGWKGPIDQDGYPDVTSEGTSALRRMARDRGENPDW